jgi:hypothetical protein
MRDNVPRSYLSIVLVMSVMLELLFLGIVNAQYDTPIPDDGPTSLPWYIGEPAKPHPLRPSGAPQNPFMMLNPWNNVHNDPWMSDTYMIAGPLGREPAILSSRLETARRNPASPMFDCGCITFDSRGRIVATCIGLGEASLVLLDPLSLKVLTYLHLPVNADPAAAYGSAYMYLDDRDRAVVTVTDHIWVVGQMGSTDSPTFEAPIDYDLSGVVPLGDSIQSVMPDWEGRLWFATRKSGLVGVLEPTTGAVLGTRQLNEEIGNSFAMTTDAAYVVTTKAMYRLAAGPDGIPYVVWQSKPYKNVGFKKDGQLTAGSGTSPTILDKGKYVAITDNAEHMHVVVYRTEVGLPPEERVVCEVPVFEPGLGATEDSLIGLGRSLIVANEYGYRLEFDEVNNRFKSTPTEPGVARVDIDANGKGCQVVWTNEALAAPQVGPKMSTKNGLVYLFTRKYEQAVMGYGPNGLDVYYWTAVDFRTGETVWERRVGTGPLFDGYVPGPAIGPTGTLYVGTYGGIIAMWDTP